MALQDLQGIIDDAFENRASISPDNAPSDVRDAVEQVFDGLDRGVIRVAEKKDGQWLTNQWVKKAVLLSFRLHKSEINTIPGGAYFDKVPLKFNGYDTERFEREGLRVCPGAVVRRGAYIEPTAVLMPSFVNVGAHVGAGTMVDTWATVGSCAQIGKNVHLSGGVGIGGVLEPLQAAPVIIQDNAFIGSRAIIVEGAHIDREAVIGAGVVITGSTKIIDVTQPQPHTYLGYVPPRSVVIPGSYTKHFPAGDYHVPCALIIGQRKESTDKKTSLNDALRLFD